MIKSYSPKVTHIGRKNVKSLTVFTQTIFHSLKDITRVGWEGGYITTRKSLTLVKMLDKSTSLVHY